MRHATVDGPEEHRQLKNYSYSRDQTYADQYAAHQVREGHMMFDYKGPSGNTAVIQDLKQSFRILEKNYAFYKNGDPEHDPDQVHPFWMMKVDKLFE